MWSSGSEAMIGQDGRNRTDETDFDTYLFARIVDLALQQDDRPLGRALGLSDSALTALLSAHLPDRLPDLLPERRDGLDDCPQPDADDTDPDAPEEADLRAFLLEFGAAGRPEEAWLAAIVARRSLEPHHLWQDLGLANRHDLNRLFLRHFPGLLALNAGDMKWKKFFYRQLCQREGIPICKSPNCDSCPDHAACFSAEIGTALI